MAPSKYPVELTEDERAELETFLQRGEQPVRAARRARILLMADDGVIDREIAEALGSADATPYQIRKRYHERGIDAVHRKQPDRNYERKLDGEAEARLIALACSDPPEGRSRWTLRLLADELVTYDEVEFDNIAHETVRKTKKNELQPHRQQQWVIPPEDDAESVYHMEDVLELYHESYDPARPVVCFDEHPLELIAEVHEPQPVEAGTVARHDYHYERRGTMNLFFASEPLDGWRTVTLTDRRTTEDWVTFIKELVDEHYPDAECIRLVLDNLSAHNPAAFYEYLEPTEARGLLSKVEFHFTPVHGSWLNLAEIEFNALCGQCLDRRIPNAETLRAEVQAWIERRNTADADVDWQFTTGEARVKLHRLYPQNDD